MEVALTIGASSALEEVPLTRAGISFRYVRSEVVAISIQLPEATASHA